MNKKQERLVWHYTTGLHIGRIVSHKLILTEEFTTPDQMTPGRKPAVWFSADQEWEQTANKCARNDSYCISFTKEETARYFHGLYRVGIRIAPDLIPWAKFKKELAKAEAQSLEAHGYSVGANPALWYACPSCVPYARWRALQVFKAGSWQDTDEVPSHRAPDPSIQEAIARREQEKPPA